MFKSTLSIFLLIILSAGAFADAPPGYYDEAEGLQGTALRTKLTEISARGHDPLSYDGARAQMYSYVDDYANNNKLECIYTANINAEHSWPQSQYGSRSPMVSDLHQLFPTYANENSCRSNLPFNEPSAIDSECYQDGDGSFRGELNGVDVYEVRMKQRGNTARAMLYMIVRYWNSDNSFDAGDGPQDVSQSQMDLYLKWHHEDPVDANERLRNDRVAENGVQGNRNPFVDRPEFVDYIWAGVEPTATPSPTPSPTTASPTPSPTGATPTPSPTTTGTPGTGAPWVNEIHYDNDGSDAEEGLEIAGPAATSLEGWTVVLYNGNGSAQYDSVDLSGSIPNQQNGYGTLWFPMVLQNGANDGIAFVNPQNQVVQMLSYEGTLTPIDGVAAGIPSTDIGVSESGTNPLGTSLQLIGTGTQYSDFTWSADVPQTRGLVNQGQFFPAPATPTPTPTPEPTSPPSEGFLIY
jgi:endonuclease I